MIARYMAALRVPTPYWRRRILWCLPAAVAVALIEAGSFAFLYLLLRALTEPDQVTEGALGTLYDLGGFDSESSFLWGLGIAVIILMLVKGVAAVALLWWQTAILADAEAETSASLFEAYMHAPHTFHLKTNSALIIRDVIVSTATLYQAGLLGLLTLGTEAAIITTVAFVLVLSDPLVAVLAAVLMVGAALAFVKGLGRRSRVLGRKNQEMLKVVQQEITEGVNGVKMIQVLNRQDDVSASFTSTRKRWAADRRAIVFIGQLPRYYLEFVLLLGVAAIGFGASALRDDANAVATVGLLVAAALRMIPSLNKILTAVNKAQVGMRATDRVVEQMQLVEQMQAERVEAATAEPIAFREKLEIRDVTFTYEDTERPALDHIDITIERGESIGVVGASGAGKSTLVDLLLGLLWPDSGAILVDGVALAKPALGSWRRTIGYVPQQIFIADNSLRRNVAFGVPEDEIDDDRVREAIRLAMLDEFVAGLPDGIETHTGEHGVRFSGGQRQRIGIARALYPNPELLILDEATSALDGVTEAAVAETIDSLQGHLTMVMIAHRLSTVRKCDRLVLLENGVATHQGTFGELLADSATFAEMVRQSSPADLPPAVERTT